jgi:hypothetical protein
MSLGMCSPSRNEEEIDWDNPSRPSAADPAPAAAAFAAASS